MKKARKIFTWKMLAAAVAINVIFMRIVFFDFPALAHDPEKAYRLLFFCLKSG